MYPWEELFSRILNELDHYSVNPQPENPFLLESLSPEIQNLIDLKNHMKSLYQREPDLNHREDKLNRREEKLILREKDLEKKILDTVQRQQTLARWEDALKERAQVLDAREQNIARQKTALDESAARYQQERRQLEALLPTRKASASTTEEELKRVISSFMGINAELRKTRDTLSGLQDTVLHNYRDGITNLCKLYRDLSVSGDETLRRYANQLGIILQMEFSAEPLDPRPNDPYDCTIHERLDTSRTGSRILCCKARGWRWNGELIMHAVVETEERKERK